MLAWDSRDISILRTICLSWVDGTDGTDNVKCVISQASRASVPCVPRGPGSLLWLFIPSSCVPCCYPLRPGCLISSLPCLASLTTQLHHISVGQATYHLRWLQSKRAREGSADLLLVDRRHTCLWSGPVWPVRGISPRLY